MGYKMERRIAAILLMLLFLGMGLYGLHGSSRDHALAERPSRPRLDAPWSGRVRVNDETAEDQWLSAIAVDASGNAYAVWEDYRNGHRPPYSTPFNGDIYFSYRPADGDWGANVKVNDDAGTENQGVPDIAVDASGNAYAVWDDYRNGGSDIYFSYRPFGGSWGANIKVSDDGGTWPAIAVDANGNAYAVWQSRYDIYFSYRPAGGSWGTDVKVNDDPGEAENKFPAIAVDSSGNAYAVWEDWRNGEGDVYFSYRPVGGSWGTNVKLNDGPGIPYYPGPSAVPGPPAIAVDGNGNAYAVWMDGDYVISSSYRRAAGSWWPSVKVSDEGGSWPAIAVDPSGNAYAVWQSRYDIYFSYSVAPILQYIYFPIVTKNY